MKGHSPPDLPARHVVSDLLTLPLAQWLDNFPTGGDPGPDVEEALSGS
ncbi:hypothetical protein KBZ17_11055 [Cyanobium sp. A2C-AMD]|nr:hypothetical protein [Cyanobium sp. A2C-AMD]